MKDVTNDWKNGKGTVVACHCQDIIEVGLRKSEIHLIRA
jgi:hypothetical protein